MIHTHAHRLREGGGGKTEREGSSVSNINKIKRKAKLLEGKKAENGR